MPRRASIFRGGECIVLRSADSQVGGVLHYGRMAGPLNAHDDRDAWNLGADGRYVRASADVSGHGAQDALMVRYGTTRRNPPPHTDKTR